MTRLFAGTPFDQPPRCERCDELVDDCQCGPPPKEYLDPSKQTARVRADRRKAKRMVTVIWGLDPDQSDLKALLARLKAACGSGGSIQEDAIELQGDHVERVRRELGEIGYRLR